MYEHNEKLSEAGITEETLRFFHSRTTNADWELTEAWPTYNWFLQRTKKGGETVRVRLRRGHEEKKVEYTIDPAKVRQKRINILLEEEKKKR